MKCLRCFNAIGLLSSRLREVVHGMSLQISCMLRETYQGLRELHISS